MKTIFTFFTFFSFMILGYAQCEINQPESNAFININDEIAAGQRFTACNSGVITQIRVNIGTLNATSLRLQLAAGSNTLTPDYTQDFTATTAGDVFIDLTTPFPVTNEASYAYTILPLNSTDISNLNGHTADLSPGGNAISETNGSVTGFAGDGDFTITIEEGLCVLNQPESNGFININDEIAAGQRFTACNSGLITQIRVNINALNATSLRLQLAAGSNTLTPDYTQDFTATTAGDVFIDLTTPFPVTNAESYAYTILPLNSTDISNLRGHTANLYSDGNAISETNGSVTSFAGDEDFTITIEEGLCVLNQPESNAFIIINDEIAAGQRFTACNSGVITQIRVNIGALNATSLRLQLAAGSNTLTPDYTQDFTATTAGDVFIDLTTPFPVADMQNYTYTILPLNSTANSSLGGHTANLYPDGNAISETNGTVTSFAGDEDFTITIDESPYPLNNLACNAINIPANGVIQTGFTNANANAFNGEEAIAPEEIGCSSTIGWCTGESNAANPNRVTNSVWFTFIAPASGAVEVSTCGLASFDSQLAVYAATDCNDFSSYTLVGANDDGPETCETDFDSFLPINSLTVGATYYVMVDGYQGDSGDFDISVTEVIFTSTEDNVLETSQVKVFPNPNNGAFSLALDGFDAAAEMIITTVTGQVVYRQQIQANETLVEVPLTQVAKGLYLITLISEKQKIIRKVIIE